jgi:putative NADPH-quinone reductase
MKILIINAHSNPESFNQALCNSFVDGLSESAKNEYRVLNLRDMDLAKYLAHIHVHTNLQSDIQIKKAQYSISWADHIVFFYPVRWGGIGGLFSVFVEMVIVPGFAFKYKEGSSFQDKLLIGKTASIVTTMDTPPFIYKYFFREPSINQLKNRILGFCGIKTKKIFYLGPVINSNKAKRKKWLMQIYNYGKNL